jgi:hypothetical protein
MLLLNLFIVGNMEIGNDMCRTDLMMGREPIAIEYPCEYYSELSDIDKQLKLLGS